MIAEDIIPQADDSAAGWQHQQRRGVLDRKIADIQTRFGWSHGNREFLELPPIESRQAPGGRHPEKATAILRYPVNHIVRQPIFDEPALA